MEIEQQKKNLNVQDNERNTKIENFSIHNLTAKRGKSSHQEEKKNQIITNADPFHFSIILTKKKRSKTLTI